MGRRAAWEGSVWRKVSARNFWKAKAVSLRQTTSRKFDTVALRVAPPPKHKQTPPANESIKDHAEAARLNLILVLMHWVLCKRNEGQPSQLRYRQHTLDRAFCCEYQHHPRFGRRLFTKIASATLTEPKARTWGCRCGRAESLKETLISHPHWVQVVGSARASVPRS